MVHSQVLIGNGNREAFAHFLDDLAAARDRLALPQDSIVILDNVAFHHSPLCIEMLELRGFQYKFLPPYTPYFMAIECMFSEWKHYVKVGLAGNRARDRVELNARINQFVLVPEHAARYAQHIANNCLAYTRGVRVFDN